MKVIAKCLLILISTLCIFPVCAKGLYYVDNDGVLRDSKNHAEVSFYGTNYTAPFAHAYRALNYLGVDHKIAIDRDVYHMARLGFNGFRLHLWDVELSDSAGNLIDNHHLDLLDYLIYKLEQRGIKIVLTAQTNFGNGYPDPDTDPYGAFSYRYDKHRVHDDKNAIEAQRRYITQLLKHKNPYTGRSYCKDHDIIALEINNEPSHSGTEKEVNDYVKTMVKTIRKAGWKKLILYNVSHNLHVTQVFYDTDIDGTTYQWYPLGLVARHTRRGNFLPYVDSYDIPFADSIKGFDRKARFIYEFDPADNMYSYLYPAISRTFRKAGFQWITHFAYDPIDMAWANTEYPTHYMNLAYTPRKALSLMIAAEAARTIERGADYGKYPVDTVFGDFLVSARRDLSMLNDGTKYYYTNSTEAAPKSPDSLEHVAGWGTSAVVDYPGTGAYFVDKVADGIWRLEIMPDVEIVSDPFTMPSFDKKIGNIYFQNHNITLNLPDIKEGYRIQGINDHNTYKGRADGMTFKVAPGVYLISNDSVDLKSLPKNLYPFNIGLTEYVAPAPSGQTPMVAAHSQTSIDKGESPRDIYSETAGPTSPVILLDAASGYDGIEIYVMPAKWDLVRLSPLKLSPQGHDVLDISLREGKEHYDFIIQKYVSDTISHRSVNDGMVLTLTVDSYDMDTVGTINIGVITADGFTYTADVPLSVGEITIPLKDLKLSPTLLVPGAYPEFSARQFIPDAATATPLRASEIERLQIIIPKPSGASSHIYLRNAYLR